MPSPLAAYEVGIPIDRGGKEPFVHVPVSWIAASNRCPEHVASKVALIVWFLHSVTRSKEFKVSNTDAEKFGLDRKQKAAGLRALARAGLVKISARSGKSPLVRLEWPVGKLLDRCVAVHLPPAQ